MTAVRWRASSAPTTAEEIPATAKKRAVEVVQGAKSTVTGSTAKLLGAAAAGLIAGLAVCLFLFFFRFLALGFVLTEGRSGEGLDLLDCGHDAISQNIRCKLGYFLRRFLEGRLGRHFFCDRSLSFGL